MIREDKTIVAKRQDTNGGACTFAPKLVTLANNGHVITIHYFPCAGWERPDG
jgi:hypothetical protein